jgi:hypothetical protein
MKQNAIPVLLFFSKWVLVTTCQELDVLLTVHHGTLMNQHQLDTLFLVCLLGLSASASFGRYSPIFRSLCTDAIWCNYVRRMCVDYVQVAVPPQSAHSNNKQTKKSVSSWCSFFK